MTDDLTARARLRDATIALIAGGDKPTARSVASKAGVSIGLIRHHFGTMDGLLLACDEHIATLIRDAKNDAIRGPLPNVLETLREAGQDNILRYLAHRLTESTPGIDALVDQLAADAASYIQRAIDADLMNPVPNVPVAARMLTIYSLGSLVLAPHLKRLLNIDITADNLIAEPGALIGFAGPRVIEQNVREKLPEGFQRSEFLLEKGAIDMIVDRRQMRETLADLLGMLMNEAPLPKTGDEDTLPPVTTVPASAEAAVAPETDASEAEPAEKP